MKYSIKGKQYTEFDINKRCAELMGFKGNLKYLMDSVFIPTTLGKCTRYDPCNDWNDAGKVIEKCWNELMCIVTDWNDCNYPRWEGLIMKHNCTQLVAACICLIELNE
jgi:hypothetical protein